MYFLVGFLVHSNLLIFTFHYCLFYLWCFFRNFIRIMLWLIVFSRWNYHLKFGVNSISLFLKNIHRTFFRIFSEVRPKVQNSLSLCTYSSTNLVGHQQYIFDYCWNHWFSISPILLCKCYQNLFPNEQSLHYHAKIVWYLAMEISLIVIIFHWK